MRPRSRISYAILSDYIIPNRVNPA